MEATRSIAFTSKSECRSSCKMATIEAYLPTILPKNMLVLTTDEKNYCPIASFSCKIYITLFFRYELGKEATNRVDTETLNKTAYGVYNHEGASAR